MEYDVEVRRLSQQFASDYPQSKYPELMVKLKRPYTCLLIDTHCDYLICIPFRSFISHNNAYIFKNTQRSKHSRSGLDYSKTALIKKLDYIDSATAIVDQDEYNEAMSNISKITRDIVDYINTYIRHVNQSSIIHHREFERKYKFSTLPYFHDILGL